MNKSLSALLVAALTVIGCVTASESNLPIQQTRTYNLTRFVVYEGAKIDLLAHPEHRVPMTEASKALNALVAQGKWDIGAVGVALSASGLSQFQNSEGFLIIEGTAGLATLIDLFTKKPVDLSKNRTAEAFVKGADAGLLAALNSSRPRAILPGEDAVKTEFRDAALKSRGKAF